jgi:predicted MFS family arabinose efflux permease
MSAAPAAVGATGRARSRIREAAEAFAVNLHSPALRPAQLSFGAMWAGEWAVMVALGVVAFRDGGAPAVGAVALLRMLPAALLTPFAATVADAMRRERVLMWVGATRAATLGTAALALALDGPAAAVYALAVVATIAQTMYRPAHSALLPSLSRNPQELTSANIVRGLIDSLATLTGPLAAALLLGASGPAAVFALCAGLSLWAGLLVAALPYEPPPRTSGAGPTQAARGAVEGLRTIATDRTLALLTGVTTAQTFARGCLSVLSVVLAIELLETGEAGVGILNAAVGFGAVAGSLLASLLVRRGHLAAWFGAGVALWGAPLAVIGALPGEAVAIALLALVGIGNALVDVGAFTLPARLCDDARLARMFAAFEAVLTLGVAAGAAVTPLVIDVLGVRGACVALGAVPPALVAVAWPALRRLDARMRVRDADIELLQAVPMLRPLPETTIEQLAAGLARERVKPGETVFEQGSHGERFYVIGGGCAEVVHDGRLVARLRRGECFGEIALLRDTARTATVSAGGSEALDLYVLSRDQFVGAVTGYRPSAAAGHEVVATRLRDLRGG